MIPVSVFESAAAKTLDLAVEIDALVLVGDDAFQHLDTVLKLLHLGAKRLGIAIALAAQMLDHVRSLGVGGQWAAGERLVVAVSELPGADELVRAAKRTADALRAPWTALFIETPRTATLGEAQHRRLAATMTLATQLGAAVATVPAPSVVEGIRAFLTDARATQLVVGKAKRSRWFELRHGSVVDRLVRETPGVTVHVLPVGEAPAERERVKRRGQWGRRSVQDHEF
jgi:two-component system sensor histidine kinase KdpD